MILISTIVYVAPVDPTSLTFGQRSDNATIENKRKTLGLDLPLHQQLVFYLRDISPVVVIDRNDEVLSLYSHKSISISDHKSIVFKWPYLRDSYQSSRSVASIMLEAIPLTLLLAMCSFLIACVLGLILGITAALNKDTWIDQLIIALSTLGYSVPSYVSAILFAVIFAYILGPYTGLNIQGSLIEINDIGDDVWVPKNIILPACALGIRPVSVIAQLMRSAFLDVYSQDFVRTARSKGLDNLIVIKRHILRNSMNPVVTSISGWFASLLAGAFFVENVFNYRGMGLVAVNALINYDIPVILASVIFTSLIFISINIMVDYIYRWLDPRVSMS